MKKTFLTLKNVALVALVGTTLTLTSCSKEKGCMNKWSDNFSATAEVDNGECTASKTKFAGEWKMNTFTYAINNSPSQTVSNANATVTLAALTDSTFSVKTLGQDITGVDYDYELTSGSNFTDINTIKVNKSVGSDNWAGTISYASGALNYDITLTEQGGAKTNFKATLTK